MRINEIILENNNADQVEYILKKDCSRWLAEAQGHVAWRGINKLNLDTPIQSVRVPVNRRPRSMNKTTHAILDDWFLAKSGIRYRSNAFFATGNKSDASSYGVRVGIYPIGEYHYSWSPEVEDLFVYLSMGRSEFPRTKDAVWNIMDDSRYLFDKNLVSALKSNTEIMIHCNEAYYVDYNVIPSIVK